LFIPKILVIAGSCAREVVDLMIA